MYTTDAPQADSGGILSDAAQYVADRWEDFKDLPRRILDLQHRAALAAQQYRAAGNVEGERAAKALILELGRLSQLHGKIQDMAESYLPYIGLGAIAVPVAVAVGFSSLALVLLWYFRKFEVQEKALELVEQGALSEQAFRDMNAAVGPSPLRETLDYAKLALWGFLAFIGLQVFKNLPARNPPLVVFGNPPDELLSPEVMEITYRHAEDGNLYWHEFGRGVRAETQPDGSLLIYHPSKPIWREF